MRIRIVVAIVFALVMAASACAQTTDFPELAKTGTPQSIQAAIDQGADVNAEISEVTAWGLSDSKVNSDARTPLMWAAAYDPDPYVILTLLRARADINARHKVDGETVLMYAACDNENPAITTALLQAGADLKARDSDGNTPLMRAAFTASPAVIITLLQAGADVQREGHVRYDRVDERCV